jgi:GNAT superfamily N-acetyltransferase
VRDDPALSVELELRDGTPVLIRPIVPEDKERLRRGFRRLSAQSKLRRFGAPVRDLTAAQLRYLTEIDYVHHMAWIALDPAHPESTALGVARYVQLRDEPEVAEAAVVVADTFQGRGLGTILLGMLGVAASTNGIAKFRAYVVTDNRPMLEILRDLGGHVELEEPGLYRVDLRVPADPEDLPDTPTGRVFKALAKRVLPPLAVLRRTVVASRTGSA